MTSFSLQLEHDSSQSLETHLVFPLHLPTLTDLEVLTVDTTEVAVSEENVPHSMHSDQSRFLSKVRAVRRYNREIAAITSCDLVLESIVIADVRTDAAGPKHALKSLGTLKEFCCFVQRSVGRNEGQDAIALD